jgi:hypothetical protein
LVRAGFRARDSRLDRTVALKVSKAEFGERFAREVALFDIPDDPRLLALAPYAAGSGGDRFLVRVAPESATQPLEVIVNWLALLKKSPE